MKTIGFLASMLGAVLLSSSLCSCSNDDNEPAGTPVTPGGDTPPEVVEETGLTEELEAVYNQDINDFAFNALRTLAARNDGSSLVFSPVSAASVLAMLNDGAAGQTRQELLSVLGFGQASTKALNEYFLKLLVTAPEADPTTTLHLANAVFADKDCIFRQSFIEDMNQFYHAESAALDFASPAAVEYINSWCERQTEGLIPVFLNALSPDFRSILLNAMYFRGKWVTPFISKSTSSRTFYLEDGTEKEVDMMYNDKWEGNLNRYCETDSFQAVRMAYGQGSYAMTVILPKKDVATVSDILGRLNAGSWQELGSRLKRPSELLSIGLPRFTITTSDAAENLSGVLQSMGAATLFSSSAELPGILEGINLPVSEIKQKAIIRVTEEGTEAAVVTGSLILIDDPDEPVIIYFRADHPFVYVISDVNTGVVYFAGTYQG